MEEKSRWLFTGLQLPVSIFSGSKISYSRLRFANLSQWRIPKGAPTYDFAKFSQKLDEIERIWPPLDPPLYQIAYGP